MSALVGRDQLRVRLVVVIPALELAIGFLEKLLLLYVFRMAIAKGDIISAVMTFPRCLHDPRTSLKIWPQMEVSESEVQKIPAGVGMFVRFDTVDVVQIVHWNPGDW